MFRFVCASCDEAFRKDEISFKIIDEEVMTKLEERLPWLNFIPMELRENYILHRAISSPFFSRLKNVVLSARGVSVEVREDSTGLKPIEASNTLHRFIKKCLGEQPINYVHFIADGLLIILRNGSLNSDEKQGETEKLLGEMSIKTFNDFMTEMLAEIEYADLSEKDIVSNTHNHSDHVFDEECISENKDITEITRACAAIGLEEAEINNIPIDTAGICDTDVVDMMARILPPENIGTALTIQLCKDCSCVVHHDQNKAQRWPPPLALANNWASGSLPVHLRDLNTIEKKMVTLAPIYASVKVIGRNRYSLMTHTIALLATPGPAATQVTKYSYNL
jgi:hypothetical protein